MLAVNFALQAVALERDVLRTTPFDDPGIGLLPDFLHVIEPIASGGVLADH
jgi:hypothetical protein